MSDSRGINLYRREELRPKDKAKARKSRAHLIWYCDFDHPKTGKRVRLSMKTTDKAEAQEKARQEYDKRLEQAKRKDRDVTLKEAYDAMIASKRADKSAETLKQYEMWRDRTLGINPKFKGQYALGQDMLVGDLEPTHLDDIRADRAKRGYAKRTIGYELTVLRAAVFHAIEHQFARAPMVKKWKVPAGNKKTRYLMPEELEALFISLHPDTPIRGGARGGAFVPKQGRVRETRQLAYDCAVVLAWAGGRWGEVANLTWNQVRLEEGEEKLILYGSKTDDTREVPLVGRALEVLHRRKKTRTGNLVFPSPVTGNAMEDPPSGIVRAINQLGLNAPEIVKQLGKATTHSLRHTFASGMRQGGMPLDELQVMLGHHSIATTKRYAHIQAQSAFARAKEIMTDRGG